jgi:hypothetical protein
MSCLFNSLCISVNMNSSELRTNIVEYLNTNPEFIDNIKVEDIINWTFGNNLETYTRNMMNQNVWGGAIEIRAFCELFNMNVTVHVLYTGKQFTIETSKKPLKNIHINYTGNHFSPMYIEYLQ